ncbi:MAG: hypothetical protein R3236_06380, partial [Phycisphaeraceae bacterium]|nr:hypothetical protein [Phycisphaeraceae bacterium]
MIRIKCSVVACLLLLLLASVAPAGKIGYIEDFALADERAEALKQLIPGTRDYYYYHCLHFQHVEQFDQVDKLLAAWIKRYGHTARVKEIQNRQALLTYDKNPEKSLEFIRQRLGIHFNHQRESLGGEPNFPTTLDQNLISRATLMRLALRRHSNLAGFEKSSFDWLAQAELNPTRRRHL